MQNSPHDIPAFAPAEIRLDHVSKRYGEKVVLRDFSLDIAAGEFVAAIGSSGCGKTTVLKLVNGLLSPDEGRVLVKGEDIAFLDRNRLRRGIGYVIQGVGLFPHLKVRENICYVPRLSRQDCPPERVRELLDIVQLEKNLLDRYPDELSGGQRQRVGLARALAARPDILLMDEPFGAVDGITRKALQKELRAIHRSLGITVFFITHDIHEALLLGSRVLVMREGRIDQCDTPRTVLHAPATPFVRRLLEDAAPGISG